MRRNDQDRQSGLGFSVFAELDEDDDSIYD
jgi:hypothetical protein